MKMAYTEIKQKIVNCEYLPDTFLNELSLMKELGVSRTPIREAMSRLEHENLVRIVPKKGVLVSGFSLGDVREVYQVRELLEPYIIRFWGSRVDRQALRTYRDNLNLPGDDLPDWKRFLLDNELHKLIYDCCQNKYFVQLLDKVYDQNQRIRILSGRLHRRLEDTRFEHLTILERLLADDSEGAAQAMSVHLANSKQAAFDSLLISPP